MPPPPVRIWTAQLLSRSFRAPSQRSTGRLSRLSPRTFSSSRPHAAPSSLSSLPGRHNALLLLRYPRLASRPHRSLRLKSDKSSHAPNPTPHLGSPEPAPSLSQRLKKLSREYGWLALGVYLGLTALDFPFCFLAVRMLGTDKIGHYEHVAVEAVKSVIRIPFPSIGKKAESVEGSPADDVSEASAREGALGSGGQGEKAGAASSGAEACMRPVFYEVS